ncbi:hypothetical protein [Streptomyces sp. NPDC001657]|uniref:hypothetical protein n=1 Tax=Streptomyces sp. NPDC001657 TaxID=3154522 RepID=UPI00331DB185
MEVVVCDLGPDRREVVPDLRVLVVGPGPRSDSWVYVTAGCWAAMEKDGIEFRRHQGHEALEELFDDVETIPLILSGHRRVRLRPSLVSA